MKYFLVILLCAYVTLVICLRGELKVEVDKAFKKCQENPLTRVDNSIDDQLSNGVHVNLTAITPHLVCFLKEYGLLDDKGNILAPRLEQTLKWSSTSPEIYSAVSDCVKQKDTIEDTTINMIDCFLSNFDYTKI